MSIKTTSISPEDLLSHAAWLHRLARRLVDPATAEDLVQETWATAVRAKPDRARPLRPWLAEVLRNLVRMRARSRNRWQARAAAVATSASAPLPTPEELLTYHEAQRLVAHAVSQLEEPFRSTVLLCYAQEIEPSQIARQQGIPAGTVRWRLKRGLELLRGTLDAHYGKDGRSWAIALAPLCRPGGALLGRVPSTLTAGVAVTSSAVGGAPSLPSVG
ncbi:MAG TPA: RNA polymerase sigma factor, partial [Polyangia bacterium]